MSYHVDTGDPTTSDSWWVGFLASSIANSLRFYPLEGGRATLERALRDFRQSPACPPEVRRHLHTKGEK